ncbi:MAG: hypothetical protein MUQ30_05740, partial [Anaerolineae bacterium]|nr:hypothetical protein [Anaerolineae bacterium]
MSSDRVTYGRWHRFAVLVAILASTVVAGCRGSVVSPLPETVTEVAVDVVSSATPAVPRATATAETEPEIVVTPVPTP